MKCHAAYLAGSVQPDWKYCVFFFFVKFLYKIIHLDPKILHGINQPKIIQRLCKKRKRYTHHKLQCICMHYLLLKSCHGSPVMQYFYTVLKKCQTFSQVNLHSFKSYFFNKILQCLSTKIIWNLYKKHPYKFIIIFISLGANLVLSTAALKKPQGKSLQQNL